jgi:hypothetical protein
VFSGVVLGGFLCWVVLVFVLLVLVRCFSCILPMYVGVPYYFLIKFYITYQFFMRNAKIAQKKHLQSDVTT